MAMTAGRRLAGAAAAFTALAVLASAADTGHLADADRTLFEAVRAHRSPAKTTVARFLSSFGEPSVVYPAVVAAAIVRKADWRDAGLACLVVYTGAETRKRLSRVFARKRPPAAAWLTKPEGYSLPSRHTTLAALAAGACMQSLGVRRGPAGTAPFLAAACVGASRVYLGVHWPADVVTGWLFAEGWLRLTGVRRQQGSR
jgi:membrane-associated phospholipid phosphatase